MDDELQQLEAELIRLRPARPSRELLSRIDGDLGRATPARSRAPIHWLWVVALPAAAAIAFLGWRAGAGPVATSPRIPPPITPGIATVAGRVEQGVLKPVAAQNVLVSTSDEGLVVLEDGTPARRERVRYVDTILWKNPRTNASLTWSVPRDEVRLVPVSFQ